VRVLARNLLPVSLAIFLSGLFQGVYVWRAFFFVYANEDYVDLARAKGLRSGTVERRYILRPALPGLITSFGLLMVVLWQEVIALEVYFRVGGIGSLLLTALTRYNIPTVVAVVTTFAWILAITLFVLDLIYGLVDPRIRLGGGAGDQAGSAVHPVREGKRHRWWQGRKKEGNRPNSPPLPPWWRTLNPATWSLPSLRQPLTRTWHELRHYPSALFGLGIIAFLIVVSLYTLIAVPFDESVARWRGDPKYTVQMRVPRNALPVWANWFRRDKLPVTRSWSSADSSAATVTITPLSDTSVAQQVRIPFDYSSRHFPQELVVDFSTTFREKAPHIDMTWHTPDGREIRLDSMSISRSQSHFFTHDKRLERRLRGISPEQGLFMQPESDPPTVLPGRYELEITALLFEPDATLEANFSLLGAVFGLAGSDFQRRDLMIPLLWGTPVALTFGLVAALTTSFLAMFLGAIAAWFGGWTDRVVQATSEVNMILPAFPISLMVFILYSKSIWMILAVVVALNIFGVNLKTYRAVFLQVRQQPYVEAARAYGAGNWRIIGRYLVPRILGILVPRLVIMVPTYVFLEVTLAFLGVADPTFPTWGTLIAGALQLSLNTGAWHVVLLSLGVVMLTGFAFSMIGLSLERIFEPRTRER
jgi:peptide/nickel transport system permease protein